MNRTGLRRHPESINGACSHRFCFFFLLKIFPVASANLVFEKENHVRNNEKSFDLPSTVYTTPKYPPRVKH
jgi:hypothetical protein